MTLIEFLYLTVVNLGAFIAARWVYRHEGWILAIATFALVWGLCIRFFFTGGSETLAKVGFLLYRLWGFIFRQSDLKD